LTRVFSDLFPSALPLAQGAARIKKMSVKPAVDRPVLADPHLWSSTMAEFLFLYRGADVATAALSPKEMQDYMRRFQNWIVSLTKTGKLTSCGPLEKGGKTLVGPIGLVTDGPFAETKDLIGGYSVVSAKDLDEATELARDCPFLAIGGTVEIRAVLDVK
jgi:hypothetical protein